VPTFKEYAERCLALPHDWNESTRQEYEHDLRHHVFPKFKKYRLDHTQHGELRNFLDDLRIKGLSALSENRIKTVTCTTLPHSLPSEPARGSERLKPISGEAQTSTAASCGSGGHEPTPCRNTQGLGNLTQKKRSLAQGIPIPEWTFSVSDEKMLHRNTLKWDTDKCLDKIGLRGVTLHDLRHSYATIRLMKGNNLGDVSRQPGHQSVKVTDGVYCHWIPGSFRK
jgi:integrase